MCRQLNREKAKTCSNCGRITNVATTPMYSHGAVPSGKIKRANGAAQSEMGKRANSMERHNKEGKWHSRQTVQKKRCWEGWRRQRMWRLVCGRNYLRMHGMWIA